MKFGFDHVHLVGSDLDASEQFYRDKFGAPEERVRRLRELVGSPGGAGREE